MTGGSGLIKPGPPSRVRIQGSSHVMLFRSSRTAAVLAAIAAVSMTAPPAMAHGRVGIGIGNAWGWGGPGWGGWGRHRRVDAGDVLTTILIVGAVAAAAN